MDYLKQPLDGLTGVDRVRQHAINKTVARVHQSMEAFIHNMNTIHSRGGNQVVFSSINYGTDTSAEGRCVMRELLKSTYEGVGNADEIYVIIELQGYLYLMRGGVFSYREFTRPYGEQRMNDEEWQKKLETEPRLGIPEWMKEIIVPMEEAPVDNEEVFYSSGC